MKRQQEKRDAEKRREKKGCKNSSKLIIQHDSERKILNASNEEYFKCCWNNLRQGFLTAAAHFSYFCFKAN